MGRRMISCFAQCPTRLGPKLGQPLTSQHVWVQEQFCLFSFQVLFSAFGHRDWLTRRPSADFWSWHLGLSELAQLVPRCPTTTSLAVTSLRPGAQLSWSPCEFHRGWTSGLVADGFRNALTAHQGTAAAGCGPQTFGCGEGQRLQGWGGPKVDAAGACDDPL